LALASRYEACHDTISRESIGSLPANLGQNPVIGSKAYGACCDSNFKYLCVTSTKSGFGNRPPSPASQYEISNLNVLDRNVTMDRGNQLTLRKADFINPGTSSVVPTPHVLIICALGIDTGSFRKQDHWPRGLLVPELNPTSVQYAKKSCWSLHTDGACVRQRLPDQEPLRGLPVSVEWVLDNLLHKPLCTCPGFSPATTSECQCDEPVPRWWNLFGAGCPPPFAPVDFLQD
jgi:hypothetical protein